MTSQQIGDAALAVWQERREAERRGDTATVESCDRKLDELARRLAVAA